MKQWLTVEDIHEELGIPIYTIRSWIRSKKLPASKPGKQYLVKREDLEKLLKETRTVQEDEK